MLFFFNSNEDILSLFTFKGYCIITHKNMPILYLLIRVVMIL